MRTTITLADDVAAAVERLRRDEGIGRSEAVNRLARAGLSAPRTRRRFRQRTVKARLLVDVSDVADAIEIVEGPDHR
jgi:metal-responsive CopG/Arc/MetJ family transcriptional regulator